MPVYLFACISSFDLIDVGVWSVLNLFCPILPLSDLWLSLLPFCLLLYVLPPRALFRVLNLLIIPAACIHVLTMYTGRRNQHDVHCGYTWIFVVVVGWMIFLIWRDGISAKRMRVVTWRGKGGFCRRRAGGVKSSVDYLDAAIRPDHWRASQNPILLSVIMQNTFWYQRDRQKTSR